MDDRRFDSLAKALASGASRRSVFKGLLGLGAAAVTGAAVVGTDDGSVEAARRTTPTPTPPRCPGVQTWNGTKCVCPTGLSQCVPGVGPACCNDQNVDPGEPGYSTCCDNACCQGTCYAEELCCATNNRPGELPPTNRICDTTSGPECCLFSDVCCIVDGCCATVCTGGSVGADFCCPAADFCPGAGESPDLCCAGDTVCCGPNTAGNVCTDLSDDDNNCGGCGIVCDGCTTCQNGVCTPDDAECEGTLICCPSGVNDGECEVGPNCGCDSDANCAYLNKNEQCIAGHCSVVEGVGTCVEVPAANTVVCHLAGASPICDPAVTCSGTAQVCPTPGLPPAGTDCGDCSSCNGEGACIERCGVEEDCCPETDQCVPDGARCCVSNDDCTSLNNCTGAVQHTFTCGQGGYCVDTPTNCPFIDNCTPASCNAAGTACNTSTVCAIGTTCCGTDASGCVDTQTDDANCGECGNECDTAACLHCTGGQCLSVCEAGTHCNGEGTCVPDCVDLGGICSEDEECCDDECCNGVCKVPDESACLVNTDCCIAGGSCCRDTGQGLICKPGLGQCHCDSDADCAVIPGGLTCNLDDHTCEQPK